jgi:outer membrane protein
MRRAVTVRAWAACRAWGALVGLIAIGPTAARAQAQSGLKIAFISSQQILEQTPGYTAAESTFKKEYQGYQEEVQKLRQQLDSAAQAFEKQSIALSSAAKQTKQRDLQQMQQRLEQRTNELQEKTQQRQRELMQPIQARVNGVIQGLRAEGNYSLIFDADSPGSNIVAADPGLDITAKVIERLKQPK